MAKSRNELWVLMDPMFIIQEEDNLLDKHLGVFIMPEKKSVAFEESILRKGTKEHLELLGGKIKRSMMLSILVKDLRNVLKLFPN